MAKPPLPWLKPALLVGGLLPGVMLAVDGARGALGANAIELVLNQTGLLALVLLIASLACMPLKTGLGWTWPMRVRKLLGLLAFAYAALHFLTYAVLDQFFDATHIVKDVMKRPFITVGFTAFVLMVPLALTSTAASIRRLGGRRWQALHRLVYVSASLGVVHYWWLVKADVSRPLTYGAIIAVLLGARLAYRFLSAPAAGRRLVQPRPRSA